MHLGDLQWLGWGGKYVEIASVLTWWQQRLKTISGQHAVIHTSELGEFQPPCKCICTTDSTARIHIQQLVYSTIKNEIAEHFGHFTMGLFVQAKQLPVAGFDSYIIKQGTNPPNKFTVP